MTAREAEATYPGNNGMIAFASDRTTGDGVTNPEGDFEIFTMKRDGTDLNQLTANAASDFDPEWSPNGKRIAFQSDRELFSNIYVMNADGSRHVVGLAGAAFEGQDFPRLVNGTGIENPCGSDELIIQVTDAAGTPTDTRFSFVVP